MTQLIRYRIAGLNAAVWFERAAVDQKHFGRTSDAENPPFPARRIANSQRLRRAYYLIANATKAITNGQPAQPLHRPPYCFIMGGRRLAAMEGSFLKTAAEGFRRGYLPTVIDGGVTDFLTGHLEVPITFRTDA